MEEIDWVGVMREVLGVAKELLGENVGVVKDSEGRIIAIKLPGVGSDQNGVYIYHDGRQVEVGRGPGRQIER
jgi:hypothetical protein